MSLRPRSQRCLLFIGGFLLALWGLANTGKRVSLDVKVVDAASDQRLLIDAANALGSWATANVHHQASPPAAGGAAAAGGSWPYATSTAWRASSGERVAAAVSATSSADSRCEGITRSGGMSWCNKVLARKDVIGLTFGVGDRDEFSEFLSNREGVEAWLYDCVSQSPLMAGRVPNGAGKCEGNAGPCYEKAYKAFPVCIGREAGTAGGRIYDTMSGVLSGLTPQSAHLKVGGGGGGDWLAAVEDLVSNDADAEKIRTLHVELSFGSASAGEAAEQEQVARQVLALEKLATKFYVVGSSLEAMRQAWSAARACPSSSMSLWRTTCPEPVLHFSGGVGLSGLVVSFVSKALVGGGGDHAAASAPALAPAPVALPSPMPTPAPTPLVDEELLPPGDPMLTCSYTKNGKPSSLPGRPCIPPAKRWPYKQNTRWKTDIGERILRAATPFPHITEEVCGGWDMFQDQTWCKKAFTAKHVQGFSFGIAGRDMYSEYLSNQYKTPMKLFDCFQNPEDSPPLNGTAPNGTYECGTEMADICYSAPYWAYRVCLGPEAGSLEGKQYESLHSHLKDSGPLSAHVKIDVEGSEWTVLEQLIASPDDLAKIRTLDVGLHFGHGAVSEQPKQQGTTLEQRLSREVGILEGLLNAFYVTGSTLELYRQGWTPEKDCPLQQCEEPDLHLKGGFIPRLFALSLVHKRIVDPTGQFTDQDDKIIAESRAAAGLPPVSPARAPPPLGVSIAAPAPAPAPPRPAPTPRPTAPPAMVVPEQEASKNIPKDPPVVKLGPPVAKYGFYMHVFNDPAAVIHQVRQIKKVFPVSPIYIMSDGGSNFQKLCKAENCTFKLCPPANDRWHPWPFMHRIYDAAIALNVEYVIMLEPDNTIHHPITREPKADAGGLPVQSRKFGAREWVDELAQKRKPGFKWTDEMMSAGLAGGAYFRTEAILDAFADEVVANFDWNYVAERCSKEVFSSDFAMQYLLASRGWAAEPWQDASQMDKNPDVPLTGAVDAAFRHYCACYPGGKPTYKLPLQPGDAALFEGPIAKYNVKDPSCQICFYSKQYEKDWGSRECTNRYDHEYSKKLLDTHFARDGRYPVIR